MSPSPSGENGAEDEEDKAEVGAVTRDADADVATSAIATCDIENGKPIS
jgi:hypothetical protein